MVPDRDRREQRLNPSGWVVADVWSAEQDGRLQNTVFHKSWSIDQQQGLIRSLIEGTPLGVVTVSDRLLPRCYILIDGGQRLGSLREFRDGLFGVPTSWFPDGWVDPCPDLDHGDRDLRRRLRTQWSSGEASFPMLTPFGQDTVTDRIVDVHVAHLSSEHEERELAQRLNPTRNRVVVDPVAVTSPKAEDVNGADQMISEAVEMIQRLADRQAIPDAFYKPSLRRLQAWLKSRDG